MCRVNSKALRYTRIRCTTVNPTNQGEKTAVNQRSVHALLKGHHYGVSARIRWMRKTTMATVFENSILAVAGRVVETVTKKGGNQTNVFMENGTPSRSFKASVTKVSQNEIAEARSVHSGVQNKSPPAKRQRHGSKGRDGQHQAETVEKRSNARLRAK